MVLAICYTILYTEFPAPHIFVSYQVCRACIAQVGAGPSLDGATAEHGRGSSQVLGAGGGLLHPTPLSCTGGRDTPLVGSHAVPT